MTSNDLDETRRLLYMTLLARKTKRYNLAGTLVNALIHHHKVIPPTDINGDPHMPWAAENDLMDRAVRLVDGDGSDEDLTWVYRQIEQLGVIERTSTTDAEG